MITQSKGAKEEEEEEALFLLSFVWQQIFA
jgi:hypothetical protein